MSLPQDAATRRPRALVIGLDGASFSLIESFAAAGELPTFARLLREGPHGTLRSSIPPVTAPAWTSFMTGKNPGKHGLYHFVEPQQNGYQVRYTNARSRRAKTIWRMLNDAGLSVGVVNVPMTYPPEPVSGYMISGMDAPEGSSAITTPPELFPELKSRFGKVSQQVRYLGFLKTDTRRDAILTELEEMDDHYDRLAAHLMESRPVDVMMLVLTSVDTVQHFFWHYMDRAHVRYDAAGAKKYGSAILDVYKRMDGIVARLSERLAPGGALVVMSDHGFKPTSGRIVQLNQLLHDLGLLALKADTAPVLGRLVKSIDRGLRSSLSPRQKAVIARFLPRLRRKWESNLTGLARVDWANTKAYSYEVLTFPSGIWINVKGQRPEGCVAPGAEYDEVVTLVKDRLLALRDPKTGNPLVTRVFRKEEIYSGPYLDEAPDLTLEWWEGITFLGKASFTDGAREAVAYVGDQPVTSGEWSGAHGAEGVVVLGGEPFRPGLRLQGAQITDLAPTLLHTLGLPIPDDMDGRVLTEAFRAGDTERAVVTRVADTNGTASSVGTYSEEEEDKVAERLRGLGYIE